MKGSNLLSTTTHDERVAVQFLLKLMKLDECDAGDVKIALEIVRKLGVE